MKWAKRIFLFLAVNFLVVMTISIILRIFNVQPYLNAHGIDYQSLLIFCFIWGFVGAFISLSLSRKMAKWMLGVKVINPHDPAYSHLLKLVDRLARNANLPDMPEVGIFQSNDLNAFATGPSKRRSLVAVSTALLNNLSENELEAVLGHEISHIANGDMVTMTLIQGIVNAFVLFLSRALAFALSSMGKGRSNNRSFMSYYAFTFIFEILFMILGSMVVALFSRMREYRADQGGAMLSSKEKMIAALETLGKTKQSGVKKNSSLNALMISTPSKLGLLRLFSTHPSLTERIERLKQLP